MSPDVLATCLQIAKRLGKVPVVASNAFGFMGNRIYAAYRRQCEFMLEEGASPQEVDVALARFGFAMGPFAVADMSGVGALLLADEAGAAKHDLEPGARVVGMATAGVAPRIMGMGPAPASRKVLALTGLTLDQMDVIELNEAFAAQGLAVLRDLGLADDDARVNPNGGGIAIGHPLGASGARLVTTAVNQLHRAGGRYALCTMCVGVGQGVSVIIERV
jgi:acetyl-CoA acetyltransferase